MEGVSVIRLVDIDVEEECPGLEDVPVGGDNLDIGLARGSCSRILPCVVELFPDFCVYECHRSARAKTAPRLFSKCLPLPEPV